MRLGLSLVTVLALAACSREPTCEAIAEHVARITRADDAAVRGGLAGSAPFLPQFGDFDETVQQRCEQGALTEAARRCLLGARLGSQIDRCAHDHGIE